MAFNYITKVNLVNTLTGDSFLISKTSSKSKLVVAYGFLSTLAEAFKTGSDKLGIEVKSTYLGYSIDDWTNDISNRIKELDTKYCYSDVTFNNYTQNGLVQYTLCDDTKGAITIPTGFNKIRECIQKDSLVGVTGRRGEPAAIINGVSYNGEQICRESTTTTSTTKPK